MVQEVSGSKPSEFITEQSTLVGYNIPFDEYIYEQIRDDIIEHLVIKYNGIKYNHISELYLKDRIKRRIQRESVRPRVLIKNPAYFDTIIDGREYNTEQNGWIKDHLDMIKSKICTKKDICKKLCISKERLGKLLSRSL